MVVALKAIIALLAVAPLLLLGFFGVQRVPVDLARLAAITSNTFAYAASVAVLTGVFGAAFAWLVARGDFRGRKPLEALLMFPVALPAVLLCMGAFDLVSHWATGFAGIVAVTTVAYLPWVMGPTAVALQRVDAALEEAARVSGASPLRAFWEISWPLVRREWWVSVLMVFSLTAATFGVPYFLGSLSPHRFATLTTDMVERLHVSGPDAFTQALVSGAVLVALSLGVSALGKVGRQGDAGRPAIATRVSSPRWLQAAAWVFATLGIIAPLAALVVRARGYGELLATPEASSTLARSALLATVCAAVIVGVGVVWAATKRAPGADRVIRLVYALPGTLVALAWVLLAALQLRIVVLEQVTLALSLQGSVWLLGLAYVSKYLAVGIDTSEAAFGRVALALVEAARLSGASEKRALFDITLPLSKRALFASFTLLWMTFFPELTLSVLLYGPRSATAGTWLFELATYTDPQRASALAVIIAAICITLRLVRV